MADGQGSAALSDEFTEAHVDETEQVVETDGSEFDSQFKNLKSEFTRKLENITAQLQQRDQLLQQLMQQQSVSGKAKQDEVNLQDLMYEDPERYAKIIEERATMAATERVTKQYELSQRTQQVVAQVAGQYPELADVNGDAYRLATQKHEQLPANLRGTPEGARMALLETVTELGLMPINKRNQAKKNSDDFSLSGSGSQSTKRRQNTTNDEQVSPKTLAFAELLGRDVKDPKVKEALKKASARKNYKKWSSVDE